MVDVAIVCCRAIRAATPLQERVWAIKTKPGPDSDIQLTNIWPATLAEPDQLTPVYEFHEADSIIFVHLCEWVGS